MTYVAITCDYQKLIKVRRALRRKGIEAYLPAMILKRPILKASRLKYRRRVTPMMRYIIAKLPEHTAARDLWLYDIKTMKDVRGWVTIQGEPALIKEADVVELRKAVSEILLSMEAARHKRWLRTGSKVSIKAGSLAGKTGTIQDIKRKRVELEMMLFGAKRIVTVERDSLEAA